MSDFCIHEHVFSGSLYEPPESWCEFEEEVSSCEACPYRYSKEDRDADYADHIYEMKRDLVDF